MPHTFSLACDNERSNERIMFIRKTITLNGVEYRVLRGFERESDIAVCKRIEKLSRISRRVCSRNVPILQARCSTIGATQNKTHVFVAMRTRCGDILPFRTTLRILCHELAHFLTPEIGHTEQFRKKEADICRMTGIDLYDGDVRQVARRR